MQRNILKLDAFTDVNHTEEFRTIIETNHGRVLYLSLAFSGFTCIIKDCFYADRNQGRTGQNQYRSVPSKLQTFQFHIDMLLDVIETELDKKFHDVEIVKTNNVGLSPDQYIQTKCFQTH